MPKKPIVPIQDLLSNYRLAKCELEIYRNRLVKKRHVTVNAPRYHGPGVAVLDFECPPEMVAVRLPNKNVWFYPIDTVTPTPKPPKTPKP